MQEGKDEGALFSNAERHICRQAGRCAGRNVCRLYRRRGKRLDEGPIAFLAARYDREVQECRKEGKGG